MNQTRKMAIDPNLGLKIFLQVLIALVVRDCSEELSYVISSNEANLRK